MAPESQSSAERRTVAQACCAVDQQLAALDECRRLGLPAEAEEAALRVLWTDLGLAYAREVVQVAELRHRMAERE
ncbi:hypothetical protein ACQVP2_33435 [Methylobacterium aquaticum]|uniref:Uncharacterized protein n=1 Tax=Methylobacterium aquaticum TaxID=270351 RepID=A0A0J6S1M5_9HYPH|nr:hypothetical protein [Methylobacterium aquaticum]KMO27443.1 hypothetical protein VP06_30705 [Methylobacterium aquaticum]